MAWGAPAAAEAPAAEFAWQAPLRADHPLVGRVVEVATGAVVDEEAFLAQLARADFVLLGERHDHPDHHRLQARILQGLSDRGQRPALVFEMLSADVEPALAAWRAQPGADSEALRRAVAWDESGWPDFALYRPVFEAALAADLPIFAGDAPEALRRAVSRGGPEELPAEEVERMGLGDPLPEDLRRAHEAEIRAAHCGHAPEERIPAMVQVQRLRDAHLAAALRGAEARADGSGAVLIAGAGHVRRDRGVPWHLARLAREAHVEAVALVELPPEAADSDDVGELLRQLRVGASAFDWLWLTPALDDLDPCERFRDVLEAMGER